MKWSAFEIPLEKGAAPQGAGVVLKGPTNCGRQFVPLLRGTPRFLRQGVRGNENPFLISPLNASQGGESKVQASASPDQQNYFSR